jgi:membrane protease YdiL (CAAX protease family)
VVRDEGPWQLVVIAVAWMLASMTAAALFGSGLGVAFGLWRGLPHLDSGMALLRAGSGRMLLAAGGLSVSQLVLLGASLRRARRIGDGDRRAGFGWAPIERPWLVVVLAAVMIGYLLCLFLAKLWGGSGPTPPMQTYLLPRQSISWGLGVQVALVLSMTLAASIVEELFFRGWLWTGLRRHWGPAFVGLVTSLLWLLSHVGEGLDRLPYLIPAAITLSIGRHRCGSVRATIVQHFVSNAAAVGLIIGALAWR